MAMKINLLKDRRVLTEKEYNQERLILRYSAIVLSITTVIGVAIFLWNFILANRLVAIESSITEASKELSELAEANAEQIYIKNRLQLISGFLAERQIARESLQQVLTLTIPGVTISGISTDEDGEIVVNVTADNLAALSSSIDYYKKDSDFFTQAVNRGITRDKDGKYMMNVGLTIPKPKE